MANSYSREILLDGWRNAVVKISGVLTDTDVNLAPAILLSDFTNNEATAGVLTGLRVDHVWHSMGNGIEMLLTWDANTPQQIMAIAGRGKESFSFDGGLHPNQDALNYTGNINLTSTGFGSQGPPPQNFTIHLAMVKLYRQKVQ